MKEHWSSGPDSFAETLDVGSPCSPAFEELSAKACVHAITAVTKARVLIGISASRYELAVAHTKAQAVPTHASHPFTLLATRAQEQPYEQSAPHKGTAGR